MLKFNKKIVYLVLAGIFVLGGVFVFYKYNLSKPQVNSFIGQIDRVDESSIYMNGFYVFPDLQSPEAIGQTKQSLVTVKITSKTKFKRIELTRPSREELAKNNWSYRLEDLKRNESEVGFDALRQEFEELGVRVKVISSKNIYMKNKFTADYVEYSFVSLPF